MTCEVDPTKLGYLTFDPGGMYTIKWSITGGQVSESTRTQRGKPNSETNKKPTLSSAIPISEESCKKLTWCASQLFARLF